MTKRAIIATQVAVLLCVGVVVWPLLGHELYTTIFKRRRSR